jgi:hypothetical protein
MEGGEMKKKTLMAVLVCVMALAALFTSNAQAGTWYTCNISQCVSYDNFYVVVLSDASAGAAFANIPFTLYPSSATVKAMYATGLTAFANSTQVLAYIDNFIPYTTCWAIAAAK